MENKNPDNCFSRFPRSTGEAFPNTMEYGAAITKSYKRKWWKSTGYLLGVALYMLLVILLAV